MTDLIGQSRSVFLHRLRHSYFDFFKLWMIEKVPSQDEALMAGIMEELKPEIEAKLQAFSRERVVYETGKYLNGFILRPHRAVVELSKRRKQWEREILDVYNCAKSVPVVDCADGEATSLQPGSDVLEQGRGTPTSSGGAGTR